MDYANSTDLIVQKLNFLDSSTVKTFNHRDQKVHRAR